ncbi:MAG TPA: nuclear transport factor 2 family protein [Ramlibacter sp.]|nr:nuclear transport factor 2 family protein [Ramlibacter sp.]
MRAAELQDGLAAIEAAWNAGADPWDPRRLATVYTRDALFFGGRPGHCVGQPAVEAYFASYRGVIVSGTMQLLEQQIIDLEPVGFLAQGYAQFTFRLRGGQHTRSRLRTTLFVVHHEGQWEVRQHHFSADPAAPPLGT